TARRGNRRGGNRGQKVLGGLNHPCSRLKREELSSPFVNQAASPQRQSKPCPRGGPERRETRGGPSSFSRGLASRPRFVWEISLAPCLEHQQPPQHLAVIATAERMFRNESTYRFVIEQTDFGDRLRSQLLLQQRKEWTPQPRGGRERKAVLSPPD